MSTTTETPITHPRNLALPADRQTWDTWLATTTDEERTRLLRELLDAQWRARATEDCSPIAEVLDSWAATFEVYSRPGFEERQREIDRLLPTARRQTRADIERNLAIDQERDREPE